MEERSYISLSALESREADYKYMHGLHMAELPK